MGMTMKAARVNKGLSQVKAAELLGVSRDVVSNWERGVTFPDVLQLKRIEKVYEVGYNDLIFLPQNDALSVNEA